MKKKMLVTTLVAVAVFVGGFNDETSVAQAASGEIVTFAPGPHRPSPPPNRIREMRDRGYKDGFHDARRHRPPNDTRGAVGGPRERDAYRDGYHKGYHDGKHR